MYTGIKCCSYNAFLHIMAIWLQLHLQMLQSLPWMYTQQNNEQLNVHIPRLWTSTIYWCELLHSLFLLVLPVTIMVLFSIFYSLSCEVCKLPKCAETSAHKIAKRQLGVDIANALIGFFGQLLFCIANCNIIGDPTGINTIACAVSCIGTLFAKLGSNLILAVGVSRLTTAGWEVLVCSDCNRWWLFKSCL